MHTDIKIENLIFTKTPPRWHPYIKLARLDRPIGIWLLLFPCWWSIVMAYGSITYMTFKGWGLMLLFALGAILMRSAGCIINDLWDRELDARVERTQGRPLVTREISVRQAVFFLIALLAASLVILMTLPAFAIRLGLFSVLLVVTYPLMKRITWWPQLFLGLTFNWGALMGWVAVNGTLDFAPVILYVGGIFWTLAYDTIYAHQDKEFDARMGVRSTALLFADQSGKFVNLCYALALLFFLMAKIISNPHIWSLLLILLPAGHLLWQIQTWKMDNPESCLRIFKSNQVFGWLLLLVISV